MVCGATGFIGRNLTERLATDPRFSITALYHQRPPFACKGVAWLQADLTRLEDVKRALQDQDIVLQAAATTSGVRTTVSKPSRQVVDNAVMNSYIFAGAFEQSIGHVLFPSCTIMLASDDSPQREEDYDPRVPPHPLYEGAARTKLYLEHLAAFYARLGQTKFTIFRHSNVYGPFDKFDLLTSHVFGATITKVLSATDHCIVVWGSGEERRDLLHVDDLVNAFLAAIDRQVDKFGLYNIGSGQSISVRDLVEKVIQASGKALEIVHDETKPTVKTSVVLDCGKAAAELDWRPKIDLVDGTRRTIEWWRQNRPVG